jgi:hypothetical protein
MPVAVLPVWASDVVGIRAIAARATHIAISRECNLPKTVFIRTSFEVVDELEWKMNGMIAPLTAIRCCSFYIRYVYLQFM